MRGLDRKDLEELIKRFRAKIDMALNNGQFDLDKPFYNFPHGCCGDTCYLLAEYLRQNGFETIFVSGDDHGQSHAWLVLKDDRVKEMTHHQVVLPDDIALVYSKYSGNRDCKSIDCSRYEKSNIERGLIIDITADQFGETPVYIGTMNAFYERFEFVSANAYCRLTSKRLERLYQSIINADALTSDNWYDE